MPHSLITSCDKHKPVESKGENAKENKTNQPNKKHSTLNKTNKTILYIANIIPAQNFLGSFSQSKIFIYTHDMDDP